MNCSYDGGARMITFEKIAVLSFGLKDDIFPDENDLNFTVIF
jgi:hypothetical protein